MKKISLIVSVLLAVVLLGGCLKESPTVPSFEQKVTAEYNHTIYGIGIIKSIHAYTYDGADYKLTTMSLTRDVETTTAITKSEFDSAVYATGRITGFTEIPAADYRTLNPSIAHCYRSPNLVCTICGDAAGVIVVEGNDRSKIGYADANDVRELERYTEGF